MKKRFGFITIATGVFLALLGVILNDAHDVLLPV